MIRVNLVPADILAKARQKQQVMQAAVAGTAVVLAVVAASALHFVRYKALEREYAAKEREFNRLSAIVAKVEEIEKTAGAVRARLNVIIDLLKGRPSYPVFMSDFVRSVPAGVRVKSLTTTGGAANPIKLNMSAEARTPEDILAWIKNFEASGRFSPAEIGAVSVTEAGERLHHFTVTTVYTPKL